jgi:hypothetical protein
MWFKVDDHLHASRKAAKAGVPAMGLWVLAGSWSAAEELDGFVPSYMVARLGADQSAAESLVASGLWHPHEHEGEDGYQFHQWEEYQPTRAQLEVKREEARVRMKRVRDEAERKRREAEERGDSVRANSPRSSRSVTPTPTRPDPKENTNAADAAEFDAFWKQYPRKIGKTAASKAYTKARKDVSAEVIATGLENAKAVWFASNTEERFIPHAATWLNGGRWEDEQETIPGTQPVERVTLAQCPEPEVHDRHRWSDARNEFMCSGVEPW